jgi:hypothetical protein
MKSHIFIENHTHTMGLKEKIVKEILEAKLNKATEFGSNYIQKLQQFFKICIIGVARTPWLQRTGSLCL